MKTRTVNSSSDDVTDRLITAIQAAEAGHDIVTCLKANILTLALAIAAATVTIEEADTLADEALEDVKHHIRLNWKIVRETMANQEGSAGRC